MKIGLIGCFFLFFSIGIHPLFSNNLTDYDSIVCEIENTAYTNGAKAGELLNVLQKLFEEDSDNIKKNAQYIYCKALLNNTQGINDTTLLSEIRQCLDMAGRQKYFEEKILLQYSLSLTYVAKGDYAEAFTYSLHALEGFQSQKNRKFVAKTFMLLGNICAYIKSYNMAEDYYNHAFTLVSPLQLEYYHIQLNKYTLLAYKGAVQEAIDSLTAFIPMVLNYANPAIEATLYLNTGGFYRIIGETTQSLYYLKMVQNLMPQFDNRRITMTLYQNLAFYNINVHDFKQAASYFQKSKSIAIENQSPSQLFHASYGLSYLYEQMGDADSAYFYLKQCNVLRDQLSNSSKTIEAYQAYVSILLESSRKELTIAEQEIQLKNRSLILTISIALACIVVFTLLLIVIQQKKKLKEAENRDLAEQIQHDEEIQQLQAEKIESQMREIASFSLMLSNKNQILQQIAEVSKYQPSNAQEETTNNDKINHIIKNNLNVDNDWKSFMLHFDKVHPQFFKKLKELCPGLTENNLRMCAYFRIGLTSKEIAQILNILPNAVRKIRFRLKKKFGLAEEDDFNDFIRNV